MYIIGKSFLHFKKKRRKKVFTVDIFTVVILKKYMTGYFFVILFKEAVFTLKNYCFNSYIYNWRLKIMYN